MLSISCEKCEGYGFIDKVDVPQLVQCECDHGFINADAEMKVYVNVYKVTRHFGGHEEGGWYYNNYECLECIPTKNKYADDILAELERDYAHRIHGNIYSVLGGTDIQVMIEEKRCESETKERPYYE